MEKVMGTFSSAPNLSATRHGPVVLTNPSNNPVMMAKNPQPGEASGTAIAVQPVGEEALKNGKAVDPAGPTDNSAGAKTSGDPKEKDKAAEKSGDETKTATVPKKKSGPLHMFKRVLKPF
jgi:hypothetical protein